MLCILAILLPMLLTSCLSTSYIEKPYVPPLNFPTFPVLEEYERTPNGRVNVSDEWIKDIAEYKIRIEETEKTYNDIKSMYGEDNK